jgi:hypothetical protein
MPDGLSNILRSQEYASKAFRGYRRYSGLKNNLTAVVIVKGSRPTLLLNTTLLPLTKPRIILVFLARLDLHYF